MTEPYNFGPKVFVGYEHSKEGFGRFSPKTLFFAAVYNSLMKDRPVVMTTMGAPLNGKSMAISGMIEALERIVSLNNARYERQIDKREYIKYLAFEKAQNFANPGHKKGAPYTQDEYAKANSYFSRMTAEAVKTGGFVLLEAPGLAGRGNQAIYELAKRQRFFEDLTFDDYYIYLTALPLMRAQGRMIRIMSDIYGPERAMEYSDISLHNDGGSLANFPGRNSPRIFKSYEDAEMALMIELWSEGLTGPDMEGETFVKLMGEEPFYTQFKEKHFSNYWFPKVLGLSNLQVSTARNRFIKDSVFYFDSLSRYDFILRNAGKL